MPLQKITQWCLYSAAFLVPIFFLPWTIDPLETNKQFLLTILVVVAGLSWAGQVFQKKEVTFKKHVVIFLLPSFLIALTVSAILSKNFFLSWFGSANQEYTSVFTLILLSILFGLIGPIAKNPKNFSKIIISLIFGAILAGIIGLLSLFEIFLPFSFTQTQTFNTVGTINSLGIFLVISTILANSILIIEKNKNKIVLILTSVLSLITFVFLILINYWIVWGVLLFGLCILLGLIFLRANEFANSKKYFLTMFLTAGTILILFFPGWQPINRPTEVTPNFSTSISIAKQTLGGSNLWFGSGPGTYSFDYTKYRPTEINQTNFWNTRFDRGFSEILTMLPTKGLLPSLILIIFALVISLIAIKNLNKKSNQWPLGFMVFPAWLALLFSFFLYPTNFTIVFVFFLISGLIFSLSGGRHQVLSLPKSPRGIIITSIGFIVLAIISTAGIFLISQNLRAEMIFAKAVRLDRAGGDLKEVAKLIDRAASLNRFNDTFYRNLAQTLAIEVNNETEKINNNQPTEEQSKYLQALIAASLNAAQQATKLEPRNSNNWLELASLYRAFTPLITNTEVSAISAGQSAVNADPQNPINYVDLGKTYLTFADMAAAIATSSDQTVQQQAKQKKDEYFAAAEEVFNTALKLKPDYAPAHYQLAMAYEQEGKLNEAIGKMESINKYNSRDIGVMFELGVLYLKRLNENDLIRAENIFKQAITLLPSYSNAHWYLAYVYEKQGNVPAAIYEIEEVLKLNPNNEIVKSRLGNLKNSQSITTVSAAIEPVE
jgi:tetratricopeptide (TPR) repeat protein